MALLNDGFELRLRLWGELCGRGHTVKVRVSFEVRVRVEVKVRVKSSRVWG